MAAMPSRRPTKPMASLVVALTETLSSASPVISEMARRIASRCGAIFGASQINEMSAFMIRPPFAATIATAFSTKMCEAAPRHCGSLGGK